MDNKYNSILKEKKVYKDPVYQNKFPIFKKSILIGILISLIIIIISYIIYYNTILSSESIFLNNIKTLIDKYSIIYTNLDFNYNLKENYTFTGTITLNDKEYNYSLSKEKESLTTQIYKDNNKVIYYYDNNNIYTNITNNYIKLDNQLYNLKHYQTLHKNITTNPNNEINNIFLDSTVKDSATRLYNLVSYQKIFDTIKKNYNNINSSKYIKKIYLENKIPTVEVDLVLDNQTIQTILDNILKIKDDLKISIIMKNNALTNNITNIKVIINNQTKNKRYVINYKDNELTFNDNQGNNNKLVFKQGEELTLKYYKNDLLYSILTGKKTNNQYTYKYQIIDQIHTITLSTYTQNNIYNLVLETNISNTREKLQITSTTTNNPSKILIENPISYQELDEITKQTYNTPIKNILFKNNT